MVKEGELGVEPEELAAWLDRLKGPLHSFLRRMAGEAAADDLFQEVFVKAWGAAGTYEDRQRPAAWLFTIARRLAIDHNRRGRPGVSLDLASEEGASLADTLAGSDPRPEEELEQAQQREQVLAAIDSLPLDQREVFLMREHGGLSFKEISDALDIPLNTALGRMHYAVVKLRRALGPR